MTKAWVCCAALAMACQSQQLSETNDDAASDSGAPVLDAGSDDVALGDGASADASSPHEDANGRDDGGPAHPGDGKAEGGEPLAPIVCDGPGARFVTSVRDYEFGDGQSLGRDRFPEVIFGPPKGSGCCQGSLDTVSIGNGGFVIVEFEGNAIVDGPGADFIVFENAFSAGGDADMPFAELGTVSVSDDGVSWSTFECTATEAPYGSCAGWRPVYANPDENDIDPLDPAVAGGDAFDLADLGLERARFVRVEDREDLTGLSGVFDLDAVAIVHPYCP